jgi:hypothetical protein
MCDLTGRGDCQDAESFLSLSGRLGSRPCQLDPASITAGGSAGRKVGIVARLGRRASFLSIWQRQRQAGSLSAEVRAGLAPWLEA